MQQAVGRERKEKKFSEVGKKLSSGGARKRPKFAPVFAAPVSGRCNLGTKLKKAFRIQLVRILILIFHSALITQHPALLTLVKMLQFLSSRQWTVGGRQGIF